MSERKLFPHQHAALSGLRWSMAREEFGGRGKMRPLVCAPTGSGKTEIMATVTRAYLLSDKRVILTVPKISLIDQTVDRLEKHGITEVGVIQANHWMTDASKPVQVCTMQSLAARGLSATPKSSVVLVDEAHVIFEHQRKWMSDIEWRRIPFIGFSATPGTKGLGKLYDDLVVSSTTQELIDTGFLSPFMVFAPPSGIVPDLQGVKTVAGDYHEGQISERMQVTQLVADVVATWKTMARNRPTLVFAVDRAHAAKLQEEFSAAGIFCGYIDAHTPIDERKAIEGQHQRGELQVVVNIGCLTTGCDWPWVSCIVLARPTKSEMLLSQIIGRGLRTSPDTDKRDCMVLDHTTTTERLGFVTDIVWDRLDDGKSPSPAQRQKADEDLPKECGKCHMLKPPKTRECPNCGHVAVRQPKVETIAGALIEALPKKGKQYTLRQQQEWYSACLWELQRRNKNPGQAWHLFIGKFKIEPRNLSRLAVEGAPELMADVRGHIVRRNMMWAKSQKRLALPAPAA